MTNFDKQDLQVSTDKTGHFESDGHIVSVPLHLFVAGKGSQNFVFNITVDLRCKCYHFFNY